MSNKCVVVLAPNGRRQNVKVTPNTTILQILEEVCKKQGFKPEDYDIKHHNKVMDATAIMRFTGLPNNAMLEMTIATKTRSEARVKVALALESGDRVMGEFDPSDSLWQVVKSLCPDEAEVDESANILPIIFYMGREECGVASLEKTTLRSLGLTKGGAILRFFKKTPEDLHHQANVSSPLVRASNPPKESVAKPSCSGLERKRPVQENLTTGPEPALEPKQKSDNRFNAEPMLKSEAPSSMGPKVGSSFSTQKRDSDYCEAKSVDEKSGSESMEVDYADSSQASQSESNYETQSNSLAEKSEELEETVVFLGERNAVIFDMTTAKACPPQDVTDDFFELTLDDAKQLLRDMKRRQAALENQPLMTVQYRELEKSKHILNTLSNYKRCVIRIEFPNQLVLQGTFTPLEKVSHVMDFVRKYLEDPTIEFYLFITPPKTILKEEQSLFETNCVPSAIMRFMPTAGEFSPTGPFIRQELLAQTSSALAATAAARKTRDMNTKNASALLVASRSDNLQPAVAPAYVSSATPTSSSDHGLEVPRNRCSDDPSTSTTRTPNSGPVPKWFKPGK